MIIDAQAKAVARTACNARLEQEPEIYLTLCALTAEAISHLLGALYGGASPVPVTRAVPAIVQSKNAAEHLPDRLRQPLLYKAVFGLLLSLVDRGDPLGTAVREILQLDDDRIGAVWQRINQDFVMGVADEAGTVATREGNTAMADMAEKLATAARGMEQT